MNSRLELHTLLTNGSVGCHKAYFQKPESIKMTYPCIVYNLSNYDIDYADNRSYAKTKRYTLIVIDKDPDSDIPDKILNYFKLCSFDRFYTAEGLNHWAFTLYY